MQITYKTTARSAGYIAEKTQGRFYKEGYIYRDTYGPLISAEVYEDEATAYYYCCVKEKLIYE